MPIKAGNAVIVVLQNPREKLLGILDDISSAGITLRAFDLSYFDDLCRSITAGVPYLPLTHQFVPMWRVEKLTLDESTDGVPSMSDQFLKRTGKDLGEI